MKAGTIVLAQHSRNPGEVRFAERCADYLRSRGRKNVRVAFHSGTPGSNEVLEEMFVKDGVDTFCILPLAIAEGNQTVWNMPKGMGLPDNSGSWRMVGEHDVATRFATALGRSGYMAEAIVRRMGPPAPEEGILLLAYGSALSQSGKTAEYYAGALRAAGWKAACGYANHGCTAAEAAEELRGEGCTSIRVLPLCISVDGRSISNAIASLGKTDVPATILEPISGYEEFLEILDSKVPEDW